MKSKFFIIFIILFFLINNKLFFSQEQNNIKFEFLPLGVHFLPLKANYEEARVGILYYPSDGKLKVDIGNDIDLFAFYFPKINSTLTLSIEFMAYALSRNYEQNRLQIDALDGFFGGNVSFSKSYSDGKLLSRFRIIHNSAHLVDGHYDLKLHNWIDDSKPIPFAKDFGELLLGYQFLPDFGSARIYSAISYSTLIRPLILKKWTGFIGFEAATNKLTGKVFDHETNLFFASHVSLEGNPTYTLNYNNLLGIKFGKWSEKGIIFYLSYYSGSHPFSEYYYKHVNQFGIGFFVDFF